MPRRPDLPCAGCGTLLWRSTSSLPAGQAMCRECRAARRVSTHGTEKRYQAGCRCDDCRAAKTAAHRRYVLGHKARYGITPTQKIRPPAGRRCDWCGASVKSRAGRASDGLVLCKTHRDEKRNSERPSVWISRADRLAIYERDDWICQLCRLPVDPDLHPLDRMAATLDHIEPQSWALIPDHLPRNLQLAHRVCNTLRGNVAVEQALERLARQGG